MGPRARRWAVLVLLALPRLGLAEDASQDRLVSLVNLTNPEGGELQKRVETVKVQAETLGKEFKCDVLGLLNKAATSQDPAAFKKAAGTFNHACEEWRRSRGASRWPASLRVKPLRAAPGVWEMTWSFSGPDGRATWEWVKGADGPLVRWRRVGDHSIFGSP